MGVRQPDRWRRPAAARYAGRMRRLTLALSLMIALPASAQTPDLEAGARDWRQCRSCHMVQDDTGRTILRGGGRGPNLYALAGQAVAGVPGFRYSASLTAYGATGATWDYDRFAGFVADPTGYLRAALGNERARSEMGHRMIEDPANLWAYLQSLTTE